MFPCFHFLKLNKITFLLLANPWQVRRRGERDRLRLLDRAIARRDPPPDGAQVHIPEHVELLLQPVPGPGKLQCGPIHSPTQKSETACVQELIC